MKNIKMLLATLFSVGSMAQAAPQICEGEDRQNEETYRLQIEETGLPKGARVQVNASKNGYHYYTEGHFQVSDFQESGMGTYAYLKFISGNVRRFYQFFIRRGKTFLVTDKGSAQLFCE